MSSRSTTSKKAKRVERRKQKKEDTETNENHVPEMKADPVDDDPDTAALAAYLDRGYCGTIFRRTFTERAEFFKIDLHSPPGTMLTTVGTASNRALNGSKLERILFVPKKHLLYEMTAPCGRKHYQHTYIVLEKHIE